MRTLKNYINGQWVEPENDGWLDVENPSTEEVIARVPLSTMNAANEAISAAKEAFPAWAATPVSRRVEPLFKLAALIRNNEETLARMIAEEMGKSLPDARAEIKRALENTEVACGMPILQQGDKVIGCAEGIDGEVIRVPLGVFAMIAPFNFPAMVPFWFIPYALATGNTYVCKPSEQVPCTMQLLTEFIAECGFPPGVFNLVNGDRTVGEAFLENPDIAGVSVVGSTKTSRIVAVRCAQTNKRFQAMGSAKNHLVVMPDAQIDKAVANMITSCYGCAGQRCMASSAIIGVGDETYREVCARFIEESRKVIVGNPLDPELADEPMVMGPVISAKAKAFIMDMIEQGIREGATLALDGRGFVSETGHFIGPTVFTDVKPGMAIHSTEIFGPVTVIMKAESIDEAISIINEHQYGNGASIYTQSGHHARKFKLEARAGMIGVNVGIPAPVAYLPFGGMKASLFADIKAQGKAVVRFFTDEKIITERFWPV
ncbi:MAG TPA: CoA-acylating methylmalonate-semialdehyde dehydrogenase [Armatimonadota bacterium]|nr:CoA-acylating methylmalonate-semialdehyde dehydrogenase [Armatimonadota bacterium]